MPVEEYNAGGVKGFLGDLARNAYEPIADITPGIGDLRAASRGGEFAHEAVQQLKQGNFGEAAKYGLGSLGEYATTVPGVGELAGVGKAATAGLMKSAPLLGGIMVGKKSITEGPAKWFKDVIGDIQREIPDINATVSDKFAANAQAHTDPDLATVLKKNGQHQNEFTLGDVLKHDEFMAAYPDIGLQNVKVRLETKNKMGAQGYFDPKNSSFKTGIDPNAEIVINPVALREQAKRTGIPEKDVYTSVLLHEVQHLIQYHENWSLGGSPSFFENLMNPEFHREVADEIKKFSKLKNPTDEASRYLNYLHGLTQYIDEVSFNKSPTLKEPSQLYWGLLGEQQARETATRFLRAKKYGEKAYETVPRNADPLKVISPYTSLKEDEYLSQYNPNFMF